MQNRAFTPRLFIYAAIYILFYFARARENVLSSLFVAIKQKRQPLTSIETALKNFFEFFDFFWKNLKKTVDKSISF